MSKRIVTIVDYGMGNIASIANMLRKLDVSSEVTSDPEVIGHSQKLVLPGVGAFGKAMDNLLNLDLIESLNRRVLQDGIPVLGVCLGMQLMGGSSEEGGAKGLGWIPARTVRFEFEDRPALKVPHMGWNEVDPVGGSLLSGIQDPRFYFVHSFHMECDVSEDVVGWTTYGFRFPSVIERENIFGVQFHPEKSHRFGMAVLGNFVGTG